MAAGIQLGADPAWPASGVEDPRVWRHYRVDWPRLADKVGTFSRHPTEPLSEALWPA